MGAVRPDLNTRSGRTCGAGSAAARLAGQAQEASGVDGLAGVLGGIIDDRDQARAPGDGWVPGTVDDVVEGLRRQGSHVAVRHGVGVIEIGGQDGEVVDDDLGSILGRVAPVLGVVGQGEGEALPVAAGEPDELLTCHERDLEVDLAGRVPGQPGQGVRARSDVWDRGSIGLFHRDVGKGAVEALAGSG